MTRSGGEGVGDDDARDEALRVVDAAADALGLAYDMTTEPRLMREVMRAMGVNDLRTSNAAMRSFLTDAASRPLALGEMLAQVRWGIRENAPAVVDFLRVALDRGWLAESPQVLKAAHVGFLLEAITAAMCNDPGFHDDFVAHIREREREIGVDREHVVTSFLKLLPGSLNFFGTAKAMSLDMAMVYFRVGRLLAGAPVDREAVASLREAGSISWLEEKLLTPACKKGHCVCNDWLRVNIYEAAVTEHGHGFHDNALAAHVLAEHVHQHCHRESFQLRHPTPSGPTRRFYGEVAGPGNYVPVVALSEGWRSLYLTWNLAFVLGELNNLHFLLPKLLIPSVLCARRDEFLGARIVSLWVSINTAMFLNFHHLEKETGPAARAEMAAAWGEINARHARALFEAEVGGGDAVLADGFERRFRRPYATLTAQILGFFAR